jgi:PAS domain S-box-containing protein
MAMDAAKIGTWDWNLLTGEVFWSANLEALVGMPVGGFGKTFAAFRGLIHPADLEKVDLALKRALENGLPYEVEFRMTRSNGTLRWTQARGQCHFDSEGRPVRIIGIDIDIADRKLAEQQLQDAEKQYADFYDHAPDLLFSIDAKTAKVLRCNQTTCKALGYRKDQIVGRQVFELYHPDSRNEARRAFQLFLQVGHVHNVELQLRREDGSCIDISLSATAVYDGAEIVSSRSICRDITDLKRTQRALQESEAQAKARAEELTAILDAMPALTFIAHDPACQRMTSSRAAYELMKLPPGANSSKTALPSERPDHFEVTKNGKPLLPEELPIQKAAATGQSVRDTELRLEFDDGTWRDLFGHAVPLLDGGGRVRGAVGAFVDVTAWKKAEEAVRRSEGRLRRFVDANLIGIATSTLDGGIVEANDIFLNMLGYSRDEFFAGKLNWQSITPPEFHERGRQAIEELKQTGVFKSFEEDYLRKDGSRIPVLIGAAAMTQSPLEWMCFVVDMTEHKRVKELKARGRAQRELLQHEMLAREEERRRIARELHDESGQMLASLLAGLRLIQDANNLKAAKTQAKTLKKIAVQAIDDLGRLSRGLHPFALDDHGLVVALNSYADEYGKLHGIEVRISIVGLDTRRLSRPLEIALYRITQEALTNVSKHAQAQVAEISLKAGTEFLDFTISDNGRGFDPERIITHSSDKHLGLQGMRERASMLGGEFTVQSRIGGGTMKTFRIPVTFAEP